MGVRADLHLCRRLVCRRLAARDEECGTNGHHHGDNQDPDTPPQDSDIVRERGEPLFSHCGSLSCSVVTEQAGCPAASARYVHY